MKNTDYYKYAVYDANDYTIYEPMRLIEGFDTLKEARQAARVYEATTATENAKAEARAYYEGLKDDCKSYIYFGYTYVMECGIDEVTYDTEEDYLNKDWSNYEELEFYTGTIEA